MKNCAQWLLQAVESLGVDTIFGYPGGAIMPVYDALYGSNLNHILCRHEQGCGFAAIGYARSSGKVGVCLATSGPGATNLVTPLADAMIDSVPLVAITGQVANDAIGTDAFQEVDVLGLSLGVAKHSFLVTDSHELPDFLKKAFVLAQTGRPGPVLLDLPKDIQLADASNLPAVETWLADYNGLLQKASTFSIDNAQRVSVERNCDKAFDLLHRSQRPVLYVGGGVGMAKATDLMRRLSQVLDIPSAETLKGIGTLDTSHAGYLGMLGMHGWPIANLAIQQTDLLVAVGARFDDRVTGKLETFAPNAKVVHFDIDAAELNKRRSADVSIVGDLKHTLAEFLNAIQSSKQCLPDWSEWLQQCSLAHKNSKEFAYNATTKSAASKSVPRTDRKFSHCVFDEVVPTQFFNELQNQLSKSDIVSCDVGQHQMWVAQHLKFDAPSNHLSSGGLGTMGFGLPAALGAQLARPNDQSIVVSGDGSIMMNIQELATLNRYQVPVKVIVFDNQRLGMVKQWQELFFEQRYSETDLSDNPDFVQLAQACQVVGQRISRQSQVKSAIKRMLQFDGPFLLHVVIPHEENVWPLVPPGKANQDMLMGDMSSANWECEHETS